MQRFASDEDLKKVAHCLTTLPEGDARLGTTVEMAWHLRQRDSKRSKELADLAMVRLTAGAVGVPPAAPASAVQTRRETRLNLVLSEIAWLNGDLPTARLHVDKACRMAVGAPDLRALSDANWLLINICQDGGEIAMRDASLSESLRFALKAKDDERINLARVAVNMFKCMSGNGLGPHFEKSIAKSLTHKSAAVRAISYEVMAHINEDDHQVHLDSLLCAADLAQNTGQIRRAIICLSNIGTSFETLNDLPSSIEWFDKALVLARSTSWPSTTAWAALASAGAARKLKRFDVAHELVDEALALLEHQTRTTTYVCALLVRGECLHDQLMHEDARRHLTDAFALLPAIQNVEMAWFVTNLLAVTTADCNNFVDAIRHIDEALDLARLGPDPTQVIVSLNCKAKILLQRDALIPAAPLQESLDLFDEASRLAQDMPAYSIPLDVLQDRATLHATQGDFEAAYRVSTAASALNAKERLASADLRMMALQVTHKTEQVRRDAELSRAMARAEQDRSQALLASNQKLEAAMRKLEQTQAALTGTNEALSRAYTSLSEVSTTDPLTGLRNRRYFTDRIESDVAHYAAAAGDAGTSKAARGERAAETTDMCFLLVDMDHFKMVNDTHGHTAGDAVLTQLAKRLKSTIREADYIIRWGGEEFLIVARGTNREDAHFLAERIRCVVSATPFLIEGGLELTKTCSIGFSSYPAVKSRPTDFNWSFSVDLADKALYVAKRNGRDAWVGVTSITTPNKGMKVAHSAHKLDDIMDAASNGRMDLVTSIPNVNYTIETRRLRRSNGFAQTV